MDRGSHTFIHADEGELPGLRPDDGETARSGQQRAVDRGGRLLPDDQHDAELGCVEGGAAGQEARV